MPGLGLAAKLEIWSKWNFLHISMGGRVWSWSMSSVWVLAHKSSWKGIYVYCLSTATGSQLGWRMHVHWWGWETQASVRRCSQGTELEDFTLALHYCPNRIRVESFSPKIGRQFSRSIMLHFHSGSFTNYTITNKRRQVKISSLNAIIKSKLLTMTHKSL